jgi:rubrerythrin
MYVINFALEMEEVGKEYFDKLAEETSLTGIKNIFKMLAAEQQKLYDIFKAIENNANTPLSVDSKALERAIYIFAQIFNEASKGILRNDLDAYEHAMKIEADIVKFFENMEQLETNRDAKTLLGKIADEEKKLYNKIESIYDFVVAPKWNLESTEFSNLKEF